MFSSNAFDYVNILDKAADASWMREKTIAHNIANVDTPGQKRKDIEFDTTLKQAIEKTKANNLHGAVTNLDVASLQPKVFTDYAGYSYRLDGNNVDVDTENVELASEQIKYQALTESISSEFARFKAVAKQLVRRY